jgi:hypothetical protein
MTQTELAERWRISEATLERWRTEAFGPVFLKLSNQVRYRVQDVEAFEEVALRGSTKIDGLGDQKISPTQGLQPRALATTISKSRPITIWLRTGSRKNRLRPLPIGSTRRRRLQHHARPEAGMLTLITVNLEIFLCMNHVEVGVKVVNFKPMKPPSRPRFSLS